MAHASDSAEGETVGYHGEVWTDGRGYATVRLPDSAGPLEAPLEYELRDIEPSSSARVTAELRDGHFTIATERPHVKVAWRVRRRAAAHQAHRQRDEGSHA